jgi:hypothetical protein
MLATPAPPLPMLETDDPADLPTLVPTTAAIPLGLPDTSPANDLRTSVLDALQDHDRKLGLGAAGPLIEIAKEEARASTAPDSIAELAVFVDAHGLLRWVDVRSTTTGRDDWVAVARRIKDDVGSRPFRVPSGVGGVLIRLRVVLCVRMPSGGIPGAPGVLTEGLRTSPNWNDDKSPLPSASDVRPNRGAAMAAPGGPTLGPHLPNLLPSVTVGSGFDLSDFAAMPHRVAHAIVLQERVL